MHVSPVRDPLPSCETRLSEREKVHTVDGPPMFSITIATFPTRQLSVAISRAPAYLLD